MSRVRDLPQETTLGNDDLFYVVKDSAGPNGGRKIKKEDLKENIALTAAEVKQRYESNSDTNAFTDAEKSKLAGIEAGAAFQDADEVPYDNSNSGLAATEVQTAIDLVNTKADGGFRPSIVSGRILHYVGGNVRFDDVVFQIVAGDILLNPSVTNGEVYVDLDGIVKQTASGVKAPPLTVVFAKFSTDLNDIISLTDQRVRNTQSLVRGVLADIKDVRAGAAAVAGSSGRLSDADHKHNILTGAPSTQNPDVANAEGTSINLARADHTHNIPTASAIGLDTNSTNTQGSTSNFARADHTHAIASGAPSTQTPDQSNAAGSSANFAKADHTHNIPTGSAIGLDANSTNTQGSNATFARSNHTHAIATGAASSISTTSTNTAGSSANLARADHTHAVSVASQEATATADDTTASLTDVLMVGMSITPAAGTYFVTWSGSNTNSGNGAERNFISLYAGGSQVSATERSVGISGGGYVPTFTQAVIAVNGSQAIEVRWRVIAGTGTVRHRRLSILRIA